MNNAEMKIEFNLVHVGGDVWEVYFDGKKLMTGSSASCKNLLETLAEIPRRSSARHSLFTAPSGGAPEARKSRSQKDKLTPANS